MLRAPIIQNWFIITYLRDESITIEESCCSFWRWSLIGSLFRGDVSANFVVFYEFFLLLALDRSRGHHF